jgi:hypothetical protein
MAGIIEEFTTARTQSAGCEIFPGLNGSIFSTFGIVPNGIDRDRWTSFAIATSGEASPVDA